MSDVSLQTRLRRAVTEYYDALDRDDFDAVLRDFSGDVLYRRPGYDPIVGLEGLRQYYTRDRKLAAGRHVLRAMVAEDNHVAAHGMYEGELRDGTRRTIGFAAFFTFDGGGRIVEHSTYFFTPAV
ncbi:MAG: nuclear transport factor 2 family protein [Mobilicoccus sp.]|nr:nuclear transport factor 2 family protein [Mobilicoccus sp.]